MEKEKWIHEVMTSTKYPKFDIQSNLNQFKEIQKNKIKLNISINWLWPVAAVWLISTFCATKQLTQNKSLPQNNKISSELNNFVQIESYQIY